MYKNSQGHLTEFYIIFVWLRGPPSPVRIMTQVPWFMYQNRLGPSGGIYSPSFVPCFVVLYLNSLKKGSFSPNLSNLPELTSAVILWKRDHYAEHFSVNGLYKLFDLDIEDCFDFKFVRSQIMPIKYLAIILH